MRKTTFAILILCLFILPAQSQNIYNGNISIGDSVNIDVWVANAAANTGTEYRLYFEKSISYMKNFTVGSNVTMVFNQDGYFTMTGFTMTVAGAIEAPYVQITDGTITYSSANDEYYNPAWVGGSGNPIYEGIAFGGAHASAAIDFSDITLNHSGSSGPVMLRAGTYASPVSSTDPHQSGMIRLYGANSATTDDGTGFYDRGIFVYNLITGNKSAFPIAGLVEVRDVGANQGPVSVQAAQFIVGLHTSTAKLDSTAGATDGMFGSWNKVYSAVGSVADATSRVAPIWVDNQMSGTVSGEEYGIFATTGGTRPDGFIGFETSSSGYDQFLYFDATFNSGAGTMVTTDAVPGGNQDARIKVYYNGTQYYIPLYR